MKNKLKRFSRSILSSVLCLTMLLTTLVFFDIGSVISDAVVGVTSNTPTGEASKQVIFYVPEIIYLAPSTSSTSSFQYELDVKLDSSNNYVPDGAYSAIGAKNSIYFSYANASNIRLSYAWYSGSSGTLTINGLTTSSTGTSLTSKITGGTAAYSSGTTQYIWWTVTYTDTVDHIVKTVNQMTGVYSPMAGDNSTVAAEAFGRRKSSGKYACIANSCIWAAGIHSISTPLHGQTAYDGLGSIKDATLPKTSSNTSTCTSTSTPRDDKLTASNAVSKQALTYISGGTGYSGYWRQGDNEYTTEYTGYYEGKLTVDTSRISNLNQIPNLEVGLDIYEAWQADNKSKCNRSFGYNVTGSSKDYTNLLAWLTTEVGSSSLNGSRFRSQLNYAITSSTVLEINGHVQGRIAHSYPTIYLNCTVANKTSLRTEIANCIKYSNILQDCFYSASNNQYSGYKSTLVNAMKALCSVDATTVSYTPYTSSVKNNLLSSSDSSNYARGGCINAGGYLWLKQYTAKIFPTSTSGTYTLNTLSETSSAKFRTLDTLSVTKDTYTGYTYLGLSKCYLDKNTQTSDTAAAPLAKNAVFGKTSGASLTTSEMALSSSGTNTSTGEVIDTSAGTVNNKHATIESKYYTYYYLANTYTINYNLNSGTAGTNAPTSATYDVPFAVSPPTRSGYKFVGWTVTSGLDNSTAKYGNTSSPSTAISSSTTKCYNTSNSTGSDVYFSNLTPTNNGSVTLTANWIPILDLNWRFNGTDNNNGDSNKAVASIWVNGTYVKSNVADFYDGVEPGATVRIYVNIVEDGWVFTNPTTSNYIEFEMPTTTTGKRPELCSKYMVVFNGNGNTGGSTTSQAFIWGTAQNLNANGFTRTGYTFASWNTAANGSGTSYSDKQNVNSLTTTLNGTINLYAQWTANTYKVIYNGNGHTSGSTATSTHTYDVAKNLTTNGYKREYTVTFNYNGSGASNTTATATATFNGWATSAIGAKAYDNGQSVINLSTGADVNLYANWTLSTVTLPNPTRTGYTFGGWYSEPACTNFVANGGATYTPTSTLTLYAKWTANTYTITFNQQGGSGGSASAIATYDSAMPSATMPTRTGYTFKGYFTGTNGTGTQYYNANGTSTRNWNIAANTTLYAYWTNNTYTVKLDMQNGTGGTESVQATYDKDMPAATMPTRTGYTFGGYYSGTNGTGTQYYKADGTSARTWNIASNTTLYAKWTPKTYTVTLNQQNGTGGTESVTATYDAAMPAATMPTRTGYTFGGYYTGTNGSGTQYYTASGASARTWNIDSNTTLYAKWTANTYKLTFDKQGGTGGTDTATATYDSAMPAATMPTRTGYIFGGYYTGTNGSGTQYYTDKGSGVGNWNRTSDTTLYAKWTAISYTVAYDLDGGTAGGTYPTSATYDSAYLLSAPSRNGWTFAGWILLDSGANFSTAKYGDNATEVLLSFGSGKKTAIASDIYFKNLTSTNGNSVTLKAIWQKKGIVYFNYLNASSVKQTTTVDFSFTTDSPSVEVNIPTVATSVTYDGRTFTMRGWKQSYLPSDPATVSSGSTTVTVDSTGYADVGDVYVYYYAMYDCNVTLSYNVNGGNSAAPASESKKQYINPTDKSDANSIAYTTLSFSVTNIVPTNENGDTFIGWSTTNDGAVEYIGSSTITIYVNTTLYAVWIDSVTADTEAKKVQYKNTVVTYGYDAINGKELTYTLEEALKNLKLDLELEDYNAYSDSIDEYNEAKQEYVDNPSSIESIKKYQQAVIALNEATKTLSEKSVVSSFLENMTIIYKDGAETKTITNASVKDINLNHYSTATLDVLNNNYVAAKNILKNKLQYQSDLNTYVVELAKNYTSYDEIGSKPTVDFYETPAKVIKMLESEESVDAVNYLRTDYGYTYYCYVNSKTPIVFLNAVEESVILKEANDASKGTDSTLDTASTGDNTLTRSAYPTRATVTSNSGASGDITVETKNITSSDYSNYLDIGEKKGIGIGSNYSGYVNGKLLTGEDYYKAYTQIKLSPVFTSDKQEIVYTIKATDDALVWKTQDEDGKKIDPVLTEGINFATTSNMSGETAEGVSKTATISEPSKGLTICFSYHNPGNSFDVSGDAVNNDTWLNQYHLFRSSGGASNWEFPRPHNFINMKTGNPYDTYFVNDDTFGSSDKGSFFFTFKLGDSIDLTTKTVLDDGNIGYLPTLNTKDPEKIATAIKNGTISFSSLKACQYTGTRSYYKVLENGEYERGADNKYKVYYGGTGYGFFPWPKANIWSVNYYPASGSYTYVHLVDRWGNSVDRVIGVGLQDAVDVSMENNASGYTILEEGGSGIDTLSLNSSSFEILADEVSTIENDVFTTQGNTVRISTGETNKAYTLTMTDKATNSSTATVKSDENGIITLSVEDTAYESGVYTFMLNSVEVNLYDGAETDKYVLSVTGDEVDEGETAQITVTTKGDVSKLRFTDASGNTSTVSSFVQNEDGTRMWIFAKEKPAGEYTYKITVKVGYEWLDEGDIAALIFNERILDSGKVRSAEYDEETGLYKVTFEGRATKVQFVSEDGMTRTYTRYAEAVKSRKTYDADGNEVNDTARTLDHEVWYVEARLYSGQNYTVAGKFEAGWNRAEDATSTVTGK